MRMRESARNGVGAGNLGVCPEAVSEFSREPRSLPDLSPNTIGSTVQIDSDNNLRVLTSMLQRNQMRMFLKI